MSKPKQNLAEMAATQQSLASIAAEAMELSRMLVECGGELTPELEARLDFNSQSLVEKVDAYVAIEDQLEIQAAHWKRKADACAAISKRFGTYIERLRGRVKFVMKEMNVTELKGQDYRYKIRKSPPKLIVTDETKVPADFKMVIQTTVLDKDRIKDALKEGFEIPGAMIEENGALCVFENAGE